MKPIESLSEQELGEAVATEVAGWYYSDAEYTTRDHVKYRAGNWRQRGTDNCGGLPPYSTSVDACLPLIEKSREGWGFDYDRDAKSYMVTICSSYEDAAFGEGQTLAIAICRALLAATRAKKGTP